MTSIQKGIIAEPNLHASYLMFNVVDEDTQHIRQQLKKLLALFERYDDDCYEAMLSGIIAVGTGYWLELYPRQIPPELTPFPEFSEDSIVPVQACDLMVVIRSDRLDVCFEVTQGAFDCLGSSVELIKQVSGFRFYDGRDLTGFSIAPTAPMRGKKIQAGAISTDDSIFGGGSYLHAMGFELNLRRWNELPLSEQEALKGYTKIESEPLEHCQVAKELMALESQFVQHTMPFGDVQKQGSFFLSCAASPQYFSSYLELRLFGKDAVPYDRSLDYFYPLFGASFFAPSTEFINRYE